MYSIFDKLNITKQEIKNSLQMKLYLSTNNKNTNLLLRNFLLPKNINKNL